jgi:hypothetical protein
MSEIDYTRAIRAAQRRNQGVVAGILACIFAVLGIFTLGILFVPIAAFCGAVGLLRGAIAFNISGLAVSALGIFLSVVGVATSPSLLLALGLVLASNSKQPKIGDSAPQISCGSGVCFPMRPDNPADQALAASANERRAREAAWGQATSTPVPISQPPSTTTGDPHTSPEDHNSYYCLSLRLDYPYAEKCPEPWVTVDSAENKGEYNPLISCGSSGPCSPMEESEAARSAAAEANAENEREAHAHEPVTPMPPPTSKPNLAAVPQGASPDVAGEPKGRAVGAR